MILCTESTLVPNLLGLSGLATLVAAIWLYAAPRSIPITHPPARDHNTRLQAALLLIPSALWLYTSHTARQRTLQCEVGRLENQDSAAALYDMSLAVFVLFCVTLEMERSVWGVGRVFEVTVVMVMCSASAATMYIMRHLFV